MRKNKRLLVVVLTIIMFMIFSSVFVLSAEKEHENHCENHINCEVCYQLQTYEDLLKKLSIVGACAFCISGSKYILEKFINKNRIEGLFCESLISLKVELLD